MDETVDRPSAAAGIKDRLISLIFTGENLKTRERTLDQVFVSPGFIDKLRQAEPYHVFSIPELGTGKMKPGELFLNDEFTSVIPTFEKFARIPRIAIVAARSPESDGPLKPYALEVDGISNLEEIEGHKNALLTVARLKGEDDAELLLLKEMPRTLSSKGIRDFQRRETILRISAEKDQAKIIAILKEHFWVKHIESVRAPEAQQEIAGFLRKAY